MTTQELIDYYADLLILQYRGKPKAYASVQAWVELAIMDQLPLLVQDAFVLQTARGVQLDVLGKYIGISRNGFDFSGPLTLNDTDYLTILQIKILQNSQPSDLSSIETFLNSNFPGVLQVFDYQDMTMDYIFQAALGTSELAEFFVKSGLLPRPMGVRLRALIYSPGTDNFFGFRTYDYGPFNVSPFNTYDSYQTNYPWLNYTNAITP